MRNNIGLTHYKQLLTYAVSAKERGEYYGHKESHEKRHAQIICFLEEAIDKLEAKKQGKQQQ